MIKKRDYVGELQKCREELKEILRWHKYEKTPLRAQELASITRRVKAIDDLLCS